MQENLTSIELCAGAGGQALGLEQAGFGHQALVEIDAHCKKTLFANRPHWNVLQGIQSDLKLFDGKPYKGVELLAAGLPCPPFSVAGKQLGKNDERDLFPDALRIIDEVNPKAVMIENVKGFLDPSFSDYRTLLKENLGKMGYKCGWRLLNASDYGVPQLRPRVLIIAIKNNISENFDWPAVQLAPPPTVGDCLIDLMSERGWKYAELWRLKANQIAPTIVGGSKKHGGPDLGPTRARKAWEKLGVNGKTIAYEPPEKDFTGMPRLTVRMVARLQGFPDNWKFFGRKTPAYRQVGNAFPPPVARAVGLKLAEAVTAKQIYKVVA